GGGFVPGGQPGGGSLAGGGGSLAGGRGRFAGGGFSRRGGLAGGGGLARRRGLADGVSHGDADGQPGGFAGRGHRADVDRQLAAVRSRRGAPPAGSSVARPVALGSDEPRATGQFCW